VLQDSDGEALNTELRAGLRELGYRPGEDVRFELRSAGGQSGQLEKLASDLVGLNVNVIVAVFTPCALAAKRATGEIPVVATATGDPVGTGLVTSLARPGSNVTGLSNMAAEAAGKGVDVLRSILPGLRRVGVLANPIDHFTTPFLEQVHLAGRTAGIEIHPIAMAKSTDEVDSAFATIAGERAEGVVVQGIFFSKVVADSAVKHRLPTASVLRSFADAGGLVSYGANLPALFRRSAVFVDKILKGAKPSDLPVEQPTKFELVINLKTAKALGLTVSPSLLARADEVIE
jgi:putative tryptophan/tyrosine transport system substrate-binding protein